ncbi:hypothetical protein N7456_010538 [Penicillium angulare]|uniref:Ubiquinone biosynthesis O-methyltransferase, mitochondrial n=1 Tax=Penicillium angulare TaxID=116970 RepID=A0A9W9F6U3_9EURO|nr:hypothetical protein N7456_010538 [Penicillium angulare]
MPTIRPQSLPLRALRAPSTSRSQSQFSRQIKLTPSVSPVASIPSKAQSHQFLRNHTTSSVSQDEVSHFSSLASSWWDPMGPSRILHLMNPLRHEFIASCLAESSPSTDTQASTSTSTATATATASPPANLHYLDIGCGGGIFAESLARTIPLDPSNPAPTPTRAASMTAIDPTTDLIQIAKKHARLDPTVDSHLRSGKFRYLNTTLEDVLASESESNPGSTSTSTSTSSSTSSSSVTHPQFDIVTLFEVIEHIDPKTTTYQSFLEKCLSAVKPGGWLIGSTISRTFPSFLLNQVIAEAPWPIGVVPRGTHEWSKFVNPPELHGWAQEGLMRLADGGVTRAGSGALDGMLWKCVGAVYVPGFGWKMVPGSEDWGNYFWAVRRGV